jgi:hypothetical protein
MEEKPETRAINVTYLQPPDSNSYQGQLIPYYLFSLETGIAGKSIPFSTPDDEL